MINTVEKVHTPYSSPDELCTRWADAGQRANRVKKKPGAFFNYFGMETRKILDDLLEKYASDGKLQLVAVRKHLPDVLKLPPISHHSNVKEIAKLFGGVGTTRQRGEPTASIALCHLS